jgi:hypothetical protein
MAIVLYVLPLEMVLACYALVELRWFMLKRVVGFVLVSGFLANAGPSVLPSPTAVRLPEPSVIPEAILCAGIICFLAWRKHRQSN